MRYDFRVDKTNQTKQSEGNLEQVEAHRFEASLVEKLLYNLLLRAREFYTKFGIPGPFLAEGWLTACDRPLTMEPRPVGAGPDPAAPSFSNERVFLKHGERIHFDILQFDFSLSLDEIIQDWCDLLWQTFGFPQSNSFDGNTFKGAVPSKK